MRARSDYVLAGIVVALTLGIIARKVAEKRYYIAKAAAAKAATRAQNEAKAAQAAAQVNAAQAKAAPARLGPDLKVVCHRATGPIKLDGVADEEAWKAAQPLSRFAPFWQAEIKAYTPTTARLLWDDEYLYFHAEMKDVDLYADIAEHDGETWLNDVFELFFKPSPDALGYYELQVNPANTTMDVYMSSRGSGGFRRWVSAHQFGWETAVKLDGTLDNGKSSNGDDDDAGWSAEGRIPWSDFAPTGGRPAVGAIWRFALCRYDYSKAFAEPQLSSTAGLTRVDFHHYEDYSELEFAGK